MYIRRAAPDDFDEILYVYDYGRQFQIDNGNPGQWVNGYPWPWLVLEDIVKGSCYVCMTDDHRIAGVFTLFDGRDPTYEMIDGAWLNDDPYLTIHRISSSGICHGIVKFCVDWVYAQRPNIRIDTHSDNSIMRHVLPKLGFKECGIIITHNGTPRIAFQKCADA